MSGLILIFSSVTMSGISVRPVFFISRIESNSEGILHMKLLFWLQMPGLEVDLTTVIPCLEVSLCF